MQLIRVELLKSTGHRVLARVLLITMVLSSIVNADAQTYWTDYGSNINESLINPLENGASQEDLTLEVARILHTVRMDGGLTVRWIVSYVWPQYACSKDPEDQATASLDAAWYIIARTLLEQAKIEGLHVVIVMTDTAGGTFLALPSASRERGQIVERWAAHNRGRPYSQTKVPNCDSAFQDGYHGTISLREMLGTPGVLSHLANRFYTMAEFLRNYAALAGLELFNEPAFTETESPSFGAAIATIRNELYRRDESLKALPMYSGVAWWNPQIVKGLSESGELASEPYMTVHYYREAGRSPSEVRRQLMDSIDPMRRFAPNKPVIVSEAGSADPIYDLADHQSLLNAFMQVHDDAHVGLWTWGTYADDKHPQPDFKWEFNSTALSGEAFRARRIDTEWEKHYEEARATFFSFANQAKSVLVKVTIAHLAATLDDPLLRSRWYIQVGAQRFISVSRAGILLRADQDGGIDHGSHPSVVAFAADVKTHDWAEVYPLGDHRWAIDIYRCDLGLPNEPGIATPAYVVGYGIQLGRDDFKTCARSVKLANARL